MQKQTTTKEVKRNYQDGFNSYDSIYCNNLLRIPNVGNIGWKSYQKENPKATIVPTDKLDFDLELINLLYSIDYNVEDEKLLACFIFRYCIFEKAIQFYINHSHIGQTINISISKIYKTYKYYLSLCFSEFVNIIYEDDFNEGYFLEKICLDISENYQQKTIDSNGLITDNCSPDNESYEMPFISWIQHYFNKNEIFVLDNKDYTHDVQRKDINLQIFVGFSWFKEVNLLPSNWSELSIEDLINTILVFGSLKHC